MAADPLVGNYGWSTAVPPESCNYVTPVVLSILTSLRPRTVLDLGCGNGDLCARMSAAGFDVVGVDADHDAVAIARAAHPHINFYQFAVGDDPARLLSAENRQCFDAIVSTEVIEHLFSPHLLPRYANDLLAADGHLLLSTPYHGYLKNLALSLLDKWDEHHTPLWHGGHIKFWSRNTLSQLLRQCGFDVVDFRGAGRLPLLWKSMILVARKSLHTNAVSLPEKGPSGS